MSNANTSVIPKKPFIKCLYNLIKQICNHLRKCKTAISMLTSPSSSSTAMSQAFHLIAKDLPGYGPSEGRYLPHSGTSRKAVALSHCTHDYHKIHSYVKIESIKCASGAASFVCIASSDGPKRPDFSKQSRQSFSLNRNRQNEERESFEKLDESDSLSKNGLLLSLSNTTKLQSAAAPGPRENEIVELFRKVQAELRERAAVKEDRKVEASKGKGKESETVDSVLKLLRKHSIEQGKKKFNNQDLPVDQQEQSGSHNKGKSTSFLTRNNKERSRVLDPNFSSFTRPPSNFRRKSPICQVKFPAYLEENPANSTLYLNLNGEKKKFEELPDAHQQKELETEEAELELKHEHEPESSFPNGNGDVFNELSEGDSSNIDNIDVDANSGMEEVIQDEDLSLLKLPELRAIARSRGAKGYSKMKKVELVELLRVGGRE